MYYVLKLLGSEVVSDVVGSEVVSDTNGERVGSEVVGDTDGDMVGSEAVGDCDGEVDRRDQCCSVAGVRLAGKHRLSTMALSPSRSSNVLVAVKKLRPPAA